MLLVLKIGGTVEVLTGMHIGASGAFSAIGAVDSPVVRDPVSGLPLLPGSSLKGKLRSLLARQYNTKLTKTPDGDADCLTQLFGCALKGGAKRSRLIFADMVMNNWEDLKKKGVTSKTEVKFENSISRTTAVANPRQIERVVRGTTFPLDIVYELDGTEKVDEVEVKKDIRLLAEGLRLLQYDYIGGHGSRGYGKVEFSDLRLSKLYGDISDEVFQECKSVLTESVK